MPALWAKQSTALTLRIGPILDADGAEYAGAVIGDISITKNGTTAAMAAAATLTYDANGYYSLVTTTANTDTLGVGQFTCNKAGYQMPPIVFMVVPANVYDAIVLGTDKLQVDAVEISGDSTAADTLELFAETLDQATGQIDAGTLADNTLTAAALAADAVAEIAAATSTTVAVLPAVGIAADRSPGVTLTPVVGETISQAITVYQSDGTTAVDLSGKTLAVVFETMSGTDVAVVANADITVSGADDNVVTFAYPVAVTASERTLKFALRDAAAPLTMYLQGVCSVTRAPQVD